jgi:hypothetical protein
MSAVATATKNTITLKGSTAVVTEFFQFALSSILYQRGIYPPDSFEPKKQYGLTVRRPWQRCSLLPGAGWGANSSLASRAGDDRQGRQAQGLSFSRAATVLW